MAVKGIKTRRDSRTRRKTRILRQIRRSTDRPRISVFRSSLHTYAQLISTEDGRTLASASTLDKEVMEECKAIADKLAKAAEAKQAKNKEGKEGKEAPAPKASSMSTKSVMAARAVGAVLGKRLAGLNIKKVVFDRNGFLYHGRVQAVAEGAREAGLEF